MRTRLVFDSNIEAGEILSEETKMLFVDFLGNEERT
jgi:hypothetical protein